MAVELQLSGKSSTEIGRELGIGPDLVRRWTREFKSGGVKSFPGNGNINFSSEHKEILALKKALKESEIEREILKKAVSIPAYRRAGFSGRQQIYWFMKDHRQKFAVEKMCRVYKIGRSGFYALLNRKPSKRAEQMEVLPK